MSDSVVETTFKQFSQVPDDLIPDLDGQDGGSYNVGLESPDRLLNSVTGYKQTLTNVNFKKVTHCF